jgi:uncharacterized protein YdaU (DUF1376 family)
MARLPIMPIATDALVADTQHLSVDQFGAYCLLLFATWRNNGIALPDDDARMANIARVTLKRWRTSLRPVLAEFFEINDTGWHQKRLEVEWLKTEQISKKRRALMEEARKAKGRQPKNQFTFFDKPETVSRTSKSETTSNSESVAAREEEKKSEQVTFGSAAPRLVRADARPNATELKERARQRCFAFAVGTYAGDALRQRIDGLMGCDPEHNAQWWFDYIDADRKRRKWQAAA